MADPCIVGICTTIIHDTCIIHHQFFMCYNIVTIVATSHYANNFDTDPNAQFYTESVFRVSDTNHSATVSPLAILRHSVHYMLANENRSNRNQFRAKYSIFTLEHAYKLIVCSSYFLQGLTWLTHLGQFNSCRIGKK